MSGDALPAWYAEAQRERAEREQQRTGLTAEQLRHLRWMAQGPLLAMEVAQRGRRLTTEEREIAIGTLAMAELDAVVALLTHEQREEIRSWGWPYPK